MPEARQPSLVSDGAVEITLEPTAGRSPDHIGFDVKNLPESPVVIAPS